MLIPFHILGDLASGSLDLRLDLCWCTLGGCVLVCIVGLCVSVGNGNSENSELWLCNRCVVQLITLELL